MKKLLISLIALCALSWGAAQDFEVGLQTQGDGFQAFGYAGFYFKVADFSIGQFWLNPSLEIAFPITGGASVEGWGQVEFLLDTAPATLSLRGRIDHEGQVRARLGLLFGF